MSTQHLFYMDISDLPHLPIKDFAKIIADAGINIALERIEELKQKIPAPLTIVCTDNPKWDIDCGLSHVRVTRKMIEITWALSYGYSVFFMEIVDKGRDRPGQIVSFDHDHCVMPALAFIRWAMDEFEKGSTDPSNLPDKLTSFDKTLTVSGLYPDFNAQLASHQGVAKRVFQAVMAFFLHHELAHIFYPDTASGDTPESEMEADRLAARWIMQAPPNDAERIYRLIGIAIAESILASIDIHQGLKSSRTHPPGFDRLKEIIGCYASDSCDSVWNIVGHILNLHMASAGIGKDQITKINVECPGELVELMLDIIRLHYSRVGSESR